MKSLLKAYNKTEQFKLVPINQVIQALSKYSTDFERDVTADQIQKNLGKIYEVKKISDQKCILFDNENSISNKDQES